MRATSPNASFQFCPAPCYNSRRLLKEPRSSEHKAQPLASMRQHCRTIPAPELPVDLAEGSFAEIVPHFTSPLCPVLIPLLLPQQMVISINHPHLSVCLRVCFLCSIADENLVLHSLMHSCSLGLPYMSSHLHDCNGAQSLSS